MAQAIKVVRIIVILSVDHDDVLYTGLVIDLFQAFREHVVCTDDFDLFFFGVTAPSGEFDVLSRNAFHKKNVSILRGSSETFRISPVSTKCEYSNQ